MTLGPLARSARADLQQEREQVAGAWARAGAAPLAQGTRFLFDDETASFTIPQADASGARAPCVRIAVIGARGASLRARFSDAGSDEPEARASSHAGALQLSRCGRPVTRVVVTNESGRGAVEFVAVGHTGVIPTLGALLPARGTPREHPPELGPPMHLAAPAQRALAAQATALRDGATEVGETSTTASAGPGQVRLTLAPGCHRITVVASGLGKVEAARVDVDAELRDDEGTLLGRDKSEAPDARLEPCTTTTKGATLAFSGAPEGSTVLVQTARFAADGALPATFGEEARLRMDRALRKRRAAAFGAPILRAQGGSGVARVPIETDGQSCYLVVAAVSQGVPRGLGLQVEVGGSEASDERGASDDAGVLAFCAGGAPVARLSVVARGAQVRWGLLVFRAGAPSGLAGPP